VSEDQLQRLLGGVRNPIRKTRLAVTSACGLRIGEASMLEVGAIDRAGQALRIIKRGNSSGSGHHWDWLHLILLPRNAKE
jgi:integrase